MSSSTTTGLFGGELSAFLARERSNLPLSCAKIVLMSVISSGVAAGTVRNQQNAVAIADVGIVMIDTDALTRWDNSHFDVVGLTGIGRDAYGIVFGTDRGTEQ